MPQMHTLARKLVEMQSHEEALAARIEIEHALRQAAEKEAMEERTLIAEEQQRLAAEQVRLAEAAEEERKKLEEVLKCRDSETSEGAREKEARLQKELRLQRRRCDMVCDRVK